MLSEHLYNVMSVNHYKQLSDNNCLLNGMFCGRKNFHRSN